MRQLALMLMLVRIAAAYVQSGGSPFDGVEGRVCCTVQEDLCFVIIIVKHEAARPRLGWHKTRKPRKNNQANRTLKWILSFTIYLFANLAGPNFILHCFQLWPQALK